MAPPLRANKPRCPSIIPKIRTTAASTIVRLLQFKYPSQFSRCHANFYTMNEEEIIDFFTKNRYYDRWDEKRWREQMEEHPLFMTKNPEDPDKMPPLVEAMRQLKYDETVNTPVELAHQYKLDGNFKYKEKQFHDAIAAYAKGLGYLDETIVYEEKKLKGIDPIELKSTLLTNRAACHVMLGNNQEAVQDCMAALRLNPQNQRARQRMEETLKKIKKNHH